MKLFRVAVISFGASFLFAGSALSQSITGYSNIDIDQSSGMVTATCETDVDASTDEFYNAFVDCTVTNSGGNVIANGQQTDSDGEQGYAQVVLTFTGTPGTTYTVTGEHKAYLDFYANYYDQDYDESEEYSSGYYDPFNFQFYEGQINNAYNDYYQWYGPGPENEHRNGVIMLGYTTDSSTDDDQTPVITGINPSEWTSGTTVPNVTISGQYFGTNQPSLSFSPSSGISYSIIGYSDTQIIANITVDGGTPNEDVEVTVTSSGYTGAGFASGGGATSPASSPAYATVRSPLNSPEVTVIAWIDPSANDLANLSPNGANAILVGKLVTGTSACTVEVLLGF